MKKLLFIVIFALLLSQLNAIGPLATMVLLDNMDNKPSNKHSCQQCQSRQPVVRKQAEENYVVERKGNIIIITIQKQRAQ